MRDGTPPAERPDGPVGTCEFLGLVFDRLDARQALDRIAGRPADAPFAYVVTPNVDHVVRYDRCRAALDHFQDERKTLIDSENGPDSPVRAFSNRMTVYGHSENALVAAYADAWLTLCDSRILARLADLAGLPLPVVPGSDLTAAILGQAVRPSDRIAILGGRAADIEALRHRLGLTDLHHHDPPMGFIDDPAERQRAVRFVVEAGARFTFLAVGSPRQELIAHDVLTTGEASGIGLCIGASIEFLTGTQQRAPAILQRLHLEWLFRLLSNPRRLWRRYLLEGPAIFLIFRKWRKESRGSRG